MTTNRDSFADLERHSQLLEEQVDQLSAALEDWRQWMIEYEALHTEVKKLPSTASRQDLARVREAFEGELVTGKELTEIFGKDDAKKPAQIDSVLRNRLDYVTRNFVTLGKQLQTAENKLAGAQVVLNPGATDEDGLPITEIMEELDDDDNVVSYSLRTTGANDPQLLEVLQKAGFASSARPDAAAPDRELAKPEAQPHADAKGEKNGEVEDKSRRKSVTFSEDTKPAAAVAAADERAQAPATETIEDIIQSAKAQEASFSNPVIPTDESEEEAQLRRDMLQYNLAEMNPVVAELQLEEGPYTDEDMATEESDLEADDHEDDEDRWGRSTANVVDDDYRRKMIEIQERLLGKDLYNATTASAEDDPEDDVQGIGRIKVKPNEPSPSQPSKETEAEAEAAGPAESASSEAPDDKRPKIVRFASTIEVSDPSSNQTAKERAPYHTPPKPETDSSPDRVDPLSDVVERTSAQNTGPEAEAPKKVSRFKAARSNGDADADPAPAPQPPTQAITPLSSAGTAILPERPAPRSDAFAPSGPPGQTLSAAVLERDSGGDAASEQPREPDELDAAMLRQEVAVEYRKAHNRMIQRQGGFMKEDESPIRPLDDEEGGPRRMSRFKAARLARS